jgi:hypothetical protein
MTNKKNDDLELNMLNKDGKGIIVFVLMVILVLFIILVILLIAKIDLFSYFSYYSEPQNLNATIQSLPELKNSSFGGVYQFYPNMKFNHNNISYLIHSDCPDDKKTRMIQAFDLLSSKVGVINFLSNSEYPNPDIEVFCSLQEKLTPGKTDFFIAGEGGAKEIVPTGRYNVINHGVILLYGNPQNAIKCNFPNTELHELIHVFGFDHSKDEKSLMYPYLKSCSQELDISIINELTSLYSQDNLPDLYFDNVSAVKKGRYLDFNITIRNSGDTTAKDVSYSVLDDGKVVETKKIDDLKLGAGIMLSVINFKLLNTNSKEIRFVIDYYNNISEIDKSNNIAVLKF